MFTLNTRSGNLVRLENYYKIPTLEIQKRRGYNHSKLIKLSSKYKENQKYSEDKQKEQITSREMRKKNK